MLADMTAWPDRQGSRGGRDVNPEADVIEKAFVAR